MGSRGPIPMSESLRALRGNPGKRRARPRPRSERSALVAPSWLSSEAKAEWGRVTPELERRGVVMALDRAILSMYCDAWSRWVQARGLIAELIVEGRTSGAKRAPVKHPAWQVYRDAASLCVTLGKELGLSPATRLRMQLPEPIEPDSDLGYLFNPRRLSDSGLD